MKKSTALFLLGTIFITHKNSAQSFGSSNIITYTSIEWSTNQGMSWLTNQSPNLYLSGDTTTNLPSFTNNQYFFYNRITKDYGVFLGTFEILAVDILYSDNVQYITNLGIQNVYILVEPTRNTYTNILYHPVITITNYTPVVNFGTNDIQNTNTPPHP